MKRDFNNICITENSELQMKLLEDFIGRVANEQSIEDIDQYTVQGQPRGHKGRRRWMHLYRG